MVMSIGLETIRKLRRQTCLIAPPPVDIRQEIWYNIYIMGEGDNALTLTEDAMNYRDEPYIYWANPRTGEFIPVRLVVGSRPDQDGLINSDHGAIPESLVFRDTPENRLDIKDQWVAYRKLPYEEAFTLFCHRVKIMRTRG